VARRAVPEELRQLVQVPCHNGDLRRVVTLVGPPRRRLGQIAQPPGAAARLVLGDEIEQPRHGTRRRRVVRAAEGEQLGRPLVVAVPRRRCLVVGRQHQVEVGAAEAERADRRDPFPAGAAHGTTPGAGRTGCPRVPRQVGLLHVQRRRLDSVVQGQRRLDQAGQAGGALARGRKRRGS